HRHHQRHRQQLQPAGSGTGGRRGLRAHWRCPARDSTADAALCGAGRFPRTRRRAGTASSGVRHGRDAAGRGRSDRRRAVMTSIDPPATTRSMTRWRALLLAAVAACAACGIIYELALLTLSASLNGGGIVATSLIVAGYIAALGAGALLVKPLLGRAAITFIAVEALLGIIGGLSAT